MSVEPSTLVDSVVVSGISKSPKFVSGFSESSNELVSDSDSEASGIGANGKSSLSSVLAFSASLASNSAFETANGLSSCCSSLTSGSSKDAVSSSKNSESISMRLLSKGLSFSLASSVVSGDSLGTLPAAAFPAKGSISCSCDGVFSVSSDISKSISPRV